MTTPLVKSTTDELIEELEAAARLASPGQWTLTVHTNPVDRFDAQADDWTLSVGGKQVVAAEDGIRNQRDVRYIAAANPANVQALIARIRELEEAQRWINALEQLLDEDVDVLVWCDDGDHQYQCVSSHHNSFFTDEYHELIPVTHWRPLPEPPQ